MEAGAEEVEEEGGRNSTDECGNLSESRMCPKTGNVLVRNFN